MWLWLGAFGLACYFTFRFLASKTPPSLQTPDPNEQKKPATTQIDTPSSQVEAKTLPQPTSTQNELKTQPDRTPVQSTSSQSLSTPTQSEAPVPEPKPLLNESPKPNSELVSEPTPERAPEPTLDSPSETTQTTTSQAEQPIGQSEPTVGQSESIANQSEPTSLLKSIEVSQQTESTQVEETEEIVEKAQVETKTDNLQSFLTVSDPDDQPVEVQREASDPEVLQTRPKRGISNLTPPDFSLLPIPKHENELVKSLEEQQEIIKEETQEQREAEKEEQPPQNIPPSQTKIAELVDEEMPVTISVLVTMDKALAILTENNITVAPVEKYGKWIGLIDLLDVTQQAFQVFGSSDSNNITSEIQKVHQFNMLTLEDQNVTNKSQRNPLVTIPCDGSLKDAIKELRQGLHRLVVLNNEGRHWRLLSQLDVTAHLIKNPSHFFGQAADRSLQELGFLKQIHAVSAGTQTIAAFGLLLEKGTTSVAVVNDYWQLVGVISANDIKWLRGFRVSLLRQPLSSFLAQSRTKEGLPTNHTITSTPSTTLREVTELLVQKRVSRSYIIDEHWRPIGVVTLTGILKNVLLDD